MPFLGGTPFGGEREAPQGFRPMPMMQAMLEFAAPIMAYVENDTIQDPNDALQIGMQLWNFTLPNAGWIPGLTYTNKDLSRLAHTFIARFETYVARSATERSAVNWADVITQVDAGITADFAPIGSR